MQTVQQTKKIRIVIGNLQTYAQVNANSDVQAYVQLDHLQLDGKPGKFKPKVATSTDDYQDSNAVSNHEVLVQFKKKKDDPFSKEGLVDVILEDLKLEIDVPTMNGNISYNSIFNFLIVSYQFSNGLLILKKSKCVNLTRFNSCPIDPTTQVLRYKYYIIIIFRAN